MMTNPYQSILLFLQFQMLFTLSLFFFWLQWHWRRHWIYLHAGLCPLILPLDLNVPKFSCSNLLPNFLALIDMIMHFPSFKVKKIIFFRSQNIPGMKHWKFLILDITFFISVCHTAQWKTIEKERKYLYHN